MKYLIAGLGNVGAEYAHTRHNIGFDVVMAFVQKHGGSFTSDRYAFVAKVKLKGKTCICICPTTYMNLSGAAVRYWMEKEKIPRENTLVVLDDLALPLERLRIRGEGSDAGHNGLKSIQAALGSTAYPKLRFGIGNDFPKGRQSDFVLGKWKPEEAPLVQKKIAISVEAIESFVLEGLANAMNKYNKLHASVEM